MESEKRRMRFCGNEQEGMGQKKEAKTWIA